MRNDFVIVEYRESSDFISDISVRCWAKAFIGWRGSVRCVKLKPLTKRQAMMLVSELGLELALDNEYGKVWDTPERSFREAHRWDNIFYD